MSKSKPIHIFKPGTHTAMSGVAMAFTEHDLAATAQAYDPAVHEAPLVVGHPKVDAPAYGWVKSLAFSESGLQAEPDQIDAAFAELLQAGRFKKVSASFYPPESPANPVPGVFYLRHVGFLGAQPPAIKGLKQAEFADADDCVTIEFSDDCMDAGGRATQEQFAEYDDLTVARLFRGLRDWIIGEFGMDKADKVLPVYDVQQLEQSATEEIAKEQTEMDATDGILPNSFTEPGDHMAATTEALSADDIAALKAENAALKQQQLDFAEQQKRDKAADIHAKNMMFAEGLVKTGQLLPAQKDLIVSTLDYLAADETVVEFGEGDNKKPLLDALKTDLFAKLPKQIEFSEIAGADSNATGDNLTTDQYKLKWNADPAIRAEFGEFDDYAAYARAESAGLVKIKTGQ